MFELIVANLLNRVLGQYVENFDLRQLNIGIWLGAVKLRNLTLKKELLDQLDLPLDVVFGQLEELTLQIPWSNLKLKPVQVEINGFYLLAKPTLSHSYDEKEATRRELAVKRQKIDQMDIVDEERAQMALADQENLALFTESLVTKVIDNLQVTIKNIHVRYEDTEGQGLADEPYAVGGLLAELLAVLTDDSWVPSFVAITREFTRKLLTLEQLSLYMDTGTDLIYSDDADATKKAFASGLEQYLLRPVSGLGKVTMHKGGATALTPKIDGDVLFEEFGLVLDDNQYQDLVATALKFHWYQKTSKYRKFKPDTKPLEDPLGWFRFAAEAVLDEVHTKHEQWTWEHFKKRRDQRKEYVELYIDRLIGKNQDFMGTDPLKELEDELSLEDIEWFRGVARKEMKEKGLKPKATQAPQQKGWFGGWFGGGGNKAQGSDSVPADDTVVPGTFSLSQEQRDALYDTIDFHGTPEPEPQTMPREWVQYSVRAHLHRGGITINRKAALLGEMVFEGCAIDLKARTDLNLVEFNLNEFRVEDGTGTSLYKHVVSVQELGHEHETELDDDDADPFLSISYEDNPLDGAADKSVKAALKLMTIFYNPHFIEAIVAFFTPTQLHLDTMGAIMNAAQDRGGDLVALMTRIGLQYALEEHQTIQVVLDLQAPLLIMPLEPLSYRLPVAILDAGHLLVELEEADKERMRQIRAKPSYDAEDWSALKKLMYDRYRLHLRDAQFCVGPDIRLTMELLHRTGANPTAILDRFDLSLDLGVLIMPEATQLAKVTLAGDVPQVMLTINDFQYRTLMEIIDRAIPDFTPPEAPRAGKNDAMKAVASQTAQENLRVRDYQTDTKQHVFELDLVLEQVEFRLLRCTNSKTMATLPFVDMRGHQLTVNFWNLIEDMHVDVVLAALEVLTAEKLRLIGEWPEVDDTEATDLLAAPKELDIYLAVDSDDLLDPTTVVTAPKKGDKELDEGSAKTRDLTKLGTHTKPSTPSNQTSDPILRVEYNRHTRIAHWQGRDIEVDDLTVAVDITAVHFVICRKLWLLIFNFIQNTFVDDNPPPIPADALAHNSPAEEAAPAQITVDVGLHRIRFDFVEDAGVVATARLDSADVKCLIWPEAQDISGQLGKLVLEEGELQRRLLKIDLDNTVEFVYRTFDPHTNTKDWAQEVEVHTGAMVVTFVELSFMRLATYFDQFAQMKEMYTRARDALAAIEGGETRFDFVINAPTIVFPQVNDYARVKLGQLYGSNQFKDGHNNIHCGVRDTLVATYFEFAAGAQKLTVVDNIDISFDIDLTDANAVVKGVTPAINVHLTELQARYLAKLVAAVQNVADFDSPDLGDDEMLREVAYEQANAKAVANFDHRMLVGETKPQEADTPQEIVDDVVELPPPGKKPMAFSVDVLIPLVLLTLYDRTANELEVSGCQLTRLELGQFSGQVASKDGEDWAAEVLMAKVGVTDLRAGCLSKYKDIIPKSGDDDQFQVSLTKEGRAITVVMAVDRPTIVISLDWVIEVQAFYGRFSRADAMTEMRRALVQRRLLELRRALVVAPPPQDNNESDTVMGYTVLVVSPQVILLADPTQIDTKALVFKAEQVLVTQQHVTSVAANNVGLYLGSMNNLNLNYRIIDDFSVLFAYNTGDNAPGTLMTTIHMLIDPLLIKVSVKDIRLAMVVINRATEIAAKLEDENGDEHDDKSLGIYTFDDLRRSVAEYAPSIVLALEPRDVPEQPKLTVNGEEMTASFGGARFLLIGDVHELPVIDMHILPFEVKATNWLLNLSGEVQLTLHVNIFNYSQLLWELLIEEWPLAVYVTRPATTLSVDVVLRKLAEVTLTLRTVALLSQLQLMIANVDEPLKPRGEDKPYVIKNETGYPVRVYASSKEGVKLDIASGTTEPWAFEDWTEIRERMLATNDGMLTVELVDLMYESTSVSLRGEGEEVYALEPKLGVAHTRLVCDIVLQADNVKQVRLRLTVTFENKLDVAVRLQVSGCSQPQEIEVAPRQNTALPIDVVYSGEVRLAPKDHPWSTKAISWKALKQQSLMVVECPGQEQLYYYQVEAQYDPKEPLAQVYPHMHVVVLLPVEIENLLPFNCKYRLHNKTRKKLWSGTTAAGDTLFLHVATAADTLLLLVEPEGYPRSEFATVSGSGVDYALVINTPAHLELRVHYATGPNLRLVVYSPYIILNQLMQNLSICERGDPSNMFRLEWRDPRPLLFNYAGGANPKLRAQLKCDDLVLTDPISFELVGQAVAVSSQIVGKQVERNFAVAVNVGDGRYHHTKVVSITPRYVVRNRYSKPLLVLENGAVNHVKVDAGADVPLYNLHRLQERLVFLAFSTTHWSSPFSIDDVGQVLIKVQHETSQVLMKVIVRMVGATIFIQIEDLDNAWPFSLRNFTDHTFYIFQGNPNVNENGEVVKHDTNYKPVYYKLPPRLVMPYAYDYPLAIIKEIVVRGENHERVLNLQEIGKMRPFRVGSDKVDMDVIAEGPTTALAITPHVGASDSRSLTSTAASTAALADDIDRADDELTLIRVVGKFEGIGVLLVNLYRSQELCYVTLRGLELRYNELDLLQNASMKVKWIQCDNQLYGGVFPIVVYPLVVPKLGRDMAAHPAFLAAVLRVKDREDTDVSLGIVFIKYATMLLQEMLIEIDEDFLFAAMDYARFPGAAWHGSTEDTLFDPEGTTPLPHPSHLDGLLMDVYFEALHLQPVALNVSFMRTERVNLGDDEEGTGGTVMFFFDILTMAVGNVNDAPIKLNSLFIENLRLSPALLMDLMQNHYAQLFFYQLHKILGLADFLGNPVGLFKHLSLGVMDIFYEPYQGFIVNDRPQEIGIGLAKGGLSFLKKLVFGVLDLVAKVTGLIAKGLSVATMDSRFQEQRRQFQRRNRPKHALYGFGLGVNSFFDLVALGVAGVATAPMEGAEKEGAAGFFKGVGRGLVGLPTKTAIGFFDLALNFSEGVRNTTTVFDTDGIDKVRIARYIAPNQPVARYLARQAQGQYWLRHLDSGTYPNEVYVAHLVMLGQEMCVMVTFNNIMLFNINLLLTKWVVPFSHLLAVLVEPTGIQLKVKGRRDGPFLPIPEKLNRTYLYQQIGVAVTDYNKKCRVEP